MLLSEHEGFCSVCAAEWCCSFSVPFTVAFPPVPHSVPQNQGPKGCGKRKSVPLVPFSSFTVPRQTAPKKQTLFPVPVSPGRSGIHDGTPEHLKATKHS